MTTNVEGAILIAGGYGVVGGQIARLIRARHATLPLALAGRTPQRGEDLARELDNATTTRLDLDQPELFRELEGRPAAIVAAVNDPHNRLLAEAVVRGIPYLDITRWTERLRDAVWQAGLLGPQAPVMFASSWMAGVAGLVTLAAAERVGQAQRIDIAVLYHSQDKAGPDSMEYMSHLATPFPAPVDGAMVRVKPLTDGRIADFPSGGAKPVYRFETPDLVHLAARTGAKTVAMRIGFDQPTLTRALVFLARSGIWRLISSGPFERLRTALLYNPGEGGPHEIRIDITGTDGAVTATIHDPQGQTHLTALGAIIQLERLLGLDGHPPAAPGITFPEQAPSIQHALTTLANHGVQVEFSPAAG